MKLLIVLCLVAAAFATDDSRDKRYAEWGAEDAWAPEAGYAPGAGYGQGWAGGYRQPWAGRWAGARAGWNGQHEWSARPTAIIAPTVWGNVAGHAWNRHAEEPYY